MKTDLKYDNYKIYEVPIPYILESGFNHRFKFDNNYGASVVKHKFSYGYDKDLFELAVLYFEDDVPFITYSTPITDDVIGNLTNDEVLELLERIKNL